jgi:hypothetical protein
MKGSPWLPAGLALLGLTLGAVVGLSRASGISTTLVTTILTFVGGTVLTFSGFRASADKEAPIDPDRVGKGLSALMLGTLLGLGMGIYLRMGICIKDACCPNAACDARSSGDSNKASGISLNSDAESGGGACATLKQQVHDKAFEEQQGCILARQRLSYLADHCNDAK